MGPLPRPAELPEHVVGSLDSSLWPPPMCLHRQILYCTVRVYSASPTSRAHNVSWESGHSIISTLYVHFASPNIMLPVTVRTHFLTPSGAWPRVGLGWSTLNTSDSWLLHEGDTWWSRTLYSCLVILVSSILTSNLYLPCLPFRLARHPTSGSHYP